MCKYAREDLALRQHPADIAAVRAAWIRLHGPPSGGLGVGLPAGQATHDFDASGLFGLHGYRDSAITGFLRSPWCSLHRPNHVSSLFHVSSDLGDQFLLRGERAFVP